MKQQSPYLQGLELFLLLNDTTKNIIQYFGSAHASARSVLLTQRRKR